MPNDNIRKVYDALSAKYNKMAQPYEEFEQMMTDEQNRKKVYDALSSKYSNMAQSWDEFNSMLAPAAAEQVEAKPVEQAQVNAAPEQKEGGNPAVMPEAQAEQEPAPQVDEKVDSIARSLIDNPTQRYVPSTPEEGAAVAQRLQEIKGEADAEREAAQQWAEDNKEMLDQTKQEMKEARRAKWQKLGEAILSTASPAPGMTATSAAVAGGASPSQQFNAERTQEAFKEYGENKLVADALDEALDYAHAAEKGASLGQGFIDMASRPGTWDFGYSDITKGLTLQALAEKWESGEPLSEQEEKVLDMVALATYITANTQEGVGIGYKVGESLPQSLGFMASLAINPASGLGRRMMQRAATKYGKVGMRALGDMLEMGVATVSSGGGRTLADAIDRINGSTQYEISPEGLVTYGGQAEQEELGRAALKAFGNNFIENYTEAMGEYFAPLAGMLGNLTDKGLRRVGLERFADFLNAVPQSQWGQMVRQFKDLTKFNGIVGEILEEEIGMFMEPLAIGDSTLGENFAVWSADPQIRDRARENQLTTILSCALMSGALYGVEAAGARTKFDKELRQADHNGEAEWGRRDWNDIKSALNQAGPEEMVRTMKDIVYNPELDEYERRAVVEYAAKLLQTQQFNTASEEAKQEMDEVSKELMAAYDAGYRMGIKSEPQSLRAVNLAFAKAIDDVEALGVRDLAYDLISADAATREQTLQGLGVQERNAVEYFLGCEKRHSGVYDGVEFAADTQYDDAMYSLAPAVRTDEQGGRTITSAVTADGRSVYVVGGEGAMSVIIDEEGNKVPYPADQLSDIVTSDAQKVEDELRAAIDEQWQGRLKFYEAHNEKTQEPQVGMVIGDGDQTVVVTDMGDGWATVQEAKTDDEGNIIPKPDGKSRDVTKEYLLSLQDEIYDRRDMMDGKMPADKADIIIGPSPENVAAMQQRAAQWEAATGQKVRLIDSLDQVDNTQARQAIENKQFITGWFNDATGEVCFYMPNMTDVKEIDKTFIHEVVGHKGMRMLLGERGYAALCDKVWNDLMTDEQKALYMSKVEHLQGDEVSRQQSAADEYIAYYAEQMNLSPDAVDQSVWERIVQIIKDILSSLGLGQEITNDELSELLRASLARFQEQNRIIQEEAARQQAEAEAQVQEESALSKIPAITDKEGKVVDYDWTKAPDLNTALEAMREAGYDEDIIKGYAEDMAKMLQDKAKKLEKSKPTESMATRQANKAKVLELTSQIDFWQNLANYFTERKEAEQEALDAFGSDFKDVDNAVGKIIDEMDFATQVRYAAAHAQYIWADNPNGTKGFASHMIAAKGNKRSERLANIGWLANRDKGGRYPEEIAHSIFANMPDALKEGHDEMEVLDIVLDAIKSANHPATVVRGMYQELIQKREDEERMRQEQEAEEEERQKDLWAQDHGFANFQDYITFEELQETGEDIIEIPADQLENYYNTLYGTDTEGSLEPGVQGVVQQPAGQDETDGGGNTLGQAEGTPEQGVGIRTAGTEAGTDNVLPGAEGQQTPGVIQGLEDYTEQEIKDEVSDYISQFGFTPEEFEIEGIRPVGSRVSGTAKEDSDLDVLVQYNGRMSEDALFNMLNNDEHPLYIDGIRVDINPIRPDKSGTIDEWLERNKDYKKEEQPKSKAQQAVEALEGEDEENDFPQETLTPVETIRVPDSNATSSDISLYNTVDGKWRYNMSAWSDKNTMSSPATSNMTFDSREAALKDAIEYAKWYRDKLDESGTPHKGLDEFIEYAEKQINNNPDGPTLFREGSIENLHKCERAISDWLKNDTRNKSIGVVLPLDVQAQVQKVMGRAFGDNIITANSVAHAKANHGINGKKNTESSIPLRDSDFALMPDVMVAPDKVERGSTDATNRESVRFIKNLSNGIVVVVEKEQKNSPDDMETITMWANKSSGVADARNASPAIDALDVISDNDVAKIKKDAERIHLGVTIGILCEVHLPPAHQRVLLDFLIALTGHHDCR